MKGNTVIIIICWLLVAGNAGFARVLEVGAACEFPTINLALEAAVDGDVIRIRKGVYREGNILVKKSVTLQGVDYPVIDGENKTEIITVEADGVIIEGLQLQNVGTSYLEDRAGIRIRKSRNFMVRNNRLINTFFGIYLEHSRDGTISGNELTGQAVEEMSSGNAVHLWYCRHIIVKNNVAKGHRDGIYLEFVDSSQVFQNTSERNIRYGLHFMFSNHDDYYENTFRSNGAGVAVMFSKKINMWDNLFEFNWGRASYGLLLKEIYDAEIRDNIFRENTIGIYVEGSTRVQYQHNEFQRNGWAVKMSGGCLDNVITRNNFKSNTFDLAVNSQVNNNRFDGNFWSEYSGYDLDRDGVGDVPFRPVKLFNFIVGQTPEAMVLLRSLFVDIVNFSEKVSPVFTPENVVDNRPSMRMFR